MTGISLTTWAAIAEIVGAGSIITGLLVGWFQLRNFRVLQRDAVAINLAQTVYSRELASAIGKLQSVPDGISLEEMRALGDQAQKRKSTSEPAHILHRDWQE